MSAHSKSQKVFRIETLYANQRGQAKSLSNHQYDHSNSKGSYNSIGNNNSLNNDQYNSILDEIKALRAIIEPQEDLTKKVLETYKTELTEAHKIKEELDSIWEAINRTKQEIASVHVTGFNGEQMARVTNELDAIVGGTENATENILAAAEEIDQFAHEISAGVKNEQYSAMANDITEKVVAIFEACNFQDLTGQRITKVVTTLQFIEERIVRMMEIWGGIDSFSEFQPDEIPAKEGDAALLNGPRLEEEEGHASQDDIDALFN